MISVCFITFRSTEHCLLAQIVWKSLVNVWSECVIQNNPKQFAVYEFQHVIPWRYTNEYMQEQNHSSAKFILNISQHEISKHKSNYSSVFTTCLYQKYQKWVHTGTKPLQCKICTKAFTSCHYLKIHKWVHAGTKVRNLYKSFQSFYTKLWVNYRFFTRLTIEVLHPVEYDWLRLVIWVDELVWLRLENLKNWSG